MPIKPFVKRSKIFIRGLIESHVGNLDVLKRHRLTLQALPGVPDAISHIEQRWQLKKNASKEQPIFIFSAGWRSGSTLVQRLVNSCANVLIWGEPYTYSDYIRKLADALRIFSRTTPPDNFFVDSFIDQNNHQLIDQWTACLYPNPGDLWSAHRNFLLSLFSDPATRLGFANWGLKEVRLNCEYATYLNWLFPNAKFIFLYRNPYEAYRSYRSFGNWYDRWPSEPVFTAKKFGEVWLNLLSSYLQHYTSFNSFLIKYEKLISRDYNFLKLNEFLGCQVDPNIIGNQISGRKREKASRLPYLEKKFLRQAVEPLAGQIGYSAPQ
jgi:hypothetical protein